MSPQPALLRSLAVLCAATLPLVSAVQGAHAQGTVTRCVSTIYISPVKLVGFDSESGRVALYWDCGAAEACAKVRPAALAVRSPSGGQIAGSFVELSLPLASGAMYTFKPDAPLVDGMTFLVLLDAADINSGYGTFEFTRGGAPADALAEQKVQETARVQPAADGYRCTVGAGEFSCVDLSFFADHGTRLPQLETALGPVRSHLLAVTEGRAGDSTGARYSYLPTYAKDLAKGVESCVTLHALPIFGGEAVRRTVCLTTSVEPVQTTIALPELAVCAEPPVSSADGAEADALHGRWCTDRARACKEWTSVTPPDCSAFEAECPELASDAGAPRDASSEAPPRQEGAAAAANTTRGAEGGDDASVTESVAPAASAPAAPLATEDGCAVRSGKGGPSGLWPAALSLLALVSFRRRKRT